MKKGLILVAVLMLFAVSCKKPQEAKKEITKEDLKTEIDKISYSAGFSSGERFKKDELEIELEVYLRGVKDGMSESDSLLNEEEMKKEMKAVRNTIRANNRAKRKKRLEEIRKLRKANEKKGEEFLEANKAKEGVVTLKSGLQYKILEKGTGASPKATDTIICNYRGTTIDGKEFDSSFKRGKPATFALNKIIKGWKEALMLMKEGGKWELFIPPKLAYGKNGKGGDIGPNETLIFEIELIEIVKPKAQEPGKS